MRVLCEVVVSDLLPTIRSLITRELLQNYKLNQTIVSKKLGITQPAVSQYASGIRGSKAKKILSNKSILQSIKKLSKDIANKNLSAIDIHIRVCQLSHKMIAQKIYSAEEIYPGPCIIQKGK